MAIEYIHPGAIDPERLCSALTKPGAERLRSGLKDMSTALGGRVVWNINSTAKGGGVAEMLSSMLPYLRGAGIDSRWAVIEGSPEFFTVTKRIHNFIHNNRGDGGRLSIAEDEIYQQTINHNWALLCERIQAGDIVILHDPQTAGLAEKLANHGARVIWRCHIGADRSGQYNQAAWTFLLPYLDGVDGFVFSRHSYVPEPLRDRHVHVIAPSIDPNTAKNQLLDQARSEAIMAAVGLARPSDTYDPSFTRQDGSPGRVEHGCEVISSGRLRPLGEIPLLVQVSRWDRLKDHLGVMRYFADHVLPERKAQLILAGPTVYSVADDPEAAQTLDQVIDAFWQLPRSARGYIQLACLPMRDSEENAAIVSALQGSADIIIQKSLAEGFGLTVAEAMWKKKTVIASRVGGMQDQIEDGVSGYLIEPDDGRAFGRQIIELLNNPNAVIGRRAHERVRDHYLHDRQIEEQAGLIQELLVPT